MKLKILFNKENLFIILLLLFSLSINQYYGNRGVFPTDSFSHFDTGYRILLGEHPFKDYWVVSGPFVDYLQALFFYVLGVSWQTYVFHASTINAILTISTFFILKNFKLKIFYCFIYSLFFSILAYPLSGTPFVDLHSALFSFAGVYILIMAIKYDKIYYWLLLPIFFIFGFLMVGFGLGFAYSFINNEEKKKNMVEMAYEWKAKMEEKSIQQEEEILKKVA